MNDLLKLYNHAIIYSYAILKYSATNYSIFMYYFIDYIPNDDYGKTI